MYSQGCRRQTNLSVLSINKGKDSQAVKVLPKYAPKSDKFKHFYSHVHVGSTAPCFCTKHDPLRFPQKYDKGVPYWVHVQSLHVLSALYLQAAYCIY